MNLFTTELITYLLLKPKATKQCLVKSNKQNQMSFLIKKRHQKAMPEQGLSSESESRKVTPFRQSETGHMYQPR